MNGRVVFEHASCEHHENAEKIWFDALRKDDLKRFDKIHVYQVKKGRIPAEVFMTRQLLSSGSPFEKSYGYSRAVIDGDWVFVAGTTGYDYKTMTMPESAADQARQCWATLTAVLREAGARLDDIVRCNYYVTAPEYAESVLEVCGEVLAAIRPAATIIVVSGLLKPEMKVEIEVTALKKTT